MARVLTGTIILILAFSPACSRSPNSTVSSPNGVLARVNGVAITTEQFNQKWAGLPESVRGIYSDPKGKSDFLEELITRELLLQQARKMRLDREPDLKARVESFRERMLLEALLNRTVESKVAITDEEIQDYFNRNREHLPAIEEVRARHILVKTRADAQSLRDQLDRGADFAALARTHSIDSGTKDRGGELGAVRKHQVAPEMEQAIFSLLPGRISPPVQSTLGFHLIQVRERKTFKPKTAEEAGNEIRRALFREKESRLFDDMLRDLRSEAKIDIADPAPPSLDPVSGTP